MTTAVTYAPVVVAVVAAACGAIVLGTAPHTHGRLRRCWLLFAASVFTWSLGAALTFTSHALHVGTARSYGVGNVAYVAMVGLLVAAIVLNPALSPNILRVRVLANAVIIGASAATTFWFHAGQRLYERTGDVTDTIVTIAYPTVDVIVVSLALTIVIRLGHRSSPHAVVQRRTALIVTGALGMFLLGDLHELFANAAGDSWTVPVLTEAAWIVGFVLVACAARTTWRGRGASSPPERRRTPREQDRLLGAALGLAPVLATISAGAAALTDWALTRTADSIGLLMLTTVVSMVLARQSLTLSDNQKLNRSLESSVADLQHQASHDGLTGLPNRSALTDRLGATIERCAGTDQRAALLFVDLDHLKPVNDSLGHSAGDALLCTTAERISALTGPRVTRFGGDEFVVLLDDLPALDPAESAEVIGGLIVEATARPITIEGHVIRPSVSVGIAVAEPGVSPEELMRRADLALYRSKAKGRRCVSTYDPNGAGDARLRIDLEKELRTGVRNDEFEVHYQPVIELATGRVEGVETLLRWRHSTRGLLLPSAFLEEAAAAGLLSAVGERTLMRVGADLAAIRHRSDGPALSIAVNLSTTELTDPRLVQRVRNAVKTFGLDPARLVIEITEDVVIDGTIRTTIDELRSLGVQIAIDDFGTGNSSLRQLGTYPADLLKIDRSFIAHLGEDPHALTIVRAILGLARNLGLRTVAEGVETPEQARLLTRLGCDLAQGWLYAKAMPLDELEAYLMAIPPFHTAVRPGLGAALGTATAAGRAQLPRRASVEDASPMMRSSSAATGGRSPIAPTT